MAEITYADRERAVQLVASTETYKVGLQTAIAQALADQRAELTAGVSTEARREAVAKELLIQDKVGNPAWARRYPDEESRTAYWRDMLFPEERDHLLARADRLIAAYAGESR